MNIVPFDKFIDKLYLVQENDSSEPDFDEGEPTRKIDWIDSKKTREKYAQFQILKLDAPSGDVLLRNTRTGDLYVAYIFDDETLKDYFQTWPNGYHELDDDAIIAWASDHKLSDLNTGISGWENGDPIVKLTKEFADYLLKTHGGQKLIRAIKAHYRAIDDDVNEGDRRIEDKKYTTGGVILFYGKPTANGKRNLYGAYIKSIKKLARKKTDNDVVNIQDLIFRVGNNAAGNLESRRIDYTADTLKKYIGLEGMYVSINGDTKTPLWFLTKDMISIGAVINKYREEITKLDVNL